MSAPLDPDKQYLAVRFVRDNYPDWLIAESPFNPARLDQDMKVMFIAYVTPGMATDLMRNGARFLASDGEG